MARFKAEQLTPNHVKAARALLGVTADELAQVLDIGVATLRNFESGKEISGPSREEIYSGLTRHGVRFTGGAAIGVSLSVPDAWAIDLSARSCPVCDHPLPAIRTPKSVGQALRGGWTCSQCGSTVSKTGKLMRKA
ncbi:helix-turn-helix domain-containing protein [Hyphomonas sp.]|uniref:helix-turn-helix domain-containing protein n=1 Tax=Hyphomonas sp. TaxID=87 RepID=UPI00391983D4